MLDASDQVFHIQIFGEVFPSGSNNCSPWCLVYPQKFSPNSTHWKLITPPMWSCTTHNQKYHIASPRLGTVPAQLAISHQKNALFWNQSLHESSGNLTWKKLSLLLFLLFLASMAPLSKCLRLYSDKHNVSPHRHFPLNVSQYLRNFIFSKVLLIRGFWNESIKCTDKNNPVLCFARLASFHSGSFLGPAPSLSEPDEEIQANTDTALSPAQPRRNPALRTSPWTKVH